MVRSANKINDQKCQFPEYKVIKKGIGKMGDFKVIMKKSNSLFKNRPNEKFLKVDNKLYVL